MIVVEHACMVVVEHASKALAVKRLEAACQVAAAEDGLCICCINVHTWLKCCSDSHACACLLA
jgi:hypothetical protein